MSAMISTWLFLAIAIFFLWWPGHEEERMKRRRYDRERESDRLRIFTDSLITFGVGLDIDDPDLMSCVEEWMHWRTHGRGIPHSAVTHPPTRRRRLTRRR